MSDHSPYSVPHQPGRWRAFALALLVHAALLALLWFGVSWQSETPAAVEAEVWDLKTLEAAPKAKTAPAPVQAEHVPPLPSVPKAIAARPAPPVQQVEPPSQNAPDIALEQQKKTREQQRRREQEDAEKQRIVLVKKEEAQRREKQLLLQKQEREQKQEQQVQQKMLAQQKAQELQRQAQARDAAEKKKNEDQKKLAEVKASEKKHKDDAAEEQKLAAQRKENLRRMTDSASAGISKDSGSGGNGEAARSQGARGDASYIDKVRTKIKSNTTFNVPEGLDSNPAAEFEVELLPDGSIRKLRKTKSSGLPGFDDAVSRAIEKSQPFPADKSGAVPSGFTVSHKPKDQ